MQIEDLIKDVENMKEKENDPKKARKDAEEFLKARDDFRGDPDQILTKVF